MAAHNKVQKENAICRFPRNMLIEPTNICNHSCLMCANSKGTKQRGFIDDVFAKRILKEAYDQGTREVGFYGMGEPLLDKNLESYIAYAKQVGYEYIYITTNGVLLSESRARSIMDAGIDSIKFSINAANPEDYCLIHGKNEFNHVIENLICIDRLRKEKKNKIALYISYIATRFTVADEEIFRSKYQEYVDDIVFIDCKTAGDMVDEVRKYLSVDSNKDFVSTFENDICPIIFNNLYITYEGYLSMCCDDLQNYLVVADLKKENLKDAWNNQYACDLRKRHLEHRLEGTRCYNCIYGCNETVEPLNTEWAVLYDQKNWNKEREIVDRIHVWKKKNKMK